MTFVTDNPLIYILASCVVLMLATVPVTALICRYRIERAKPLSFATMLAGAATIPLLYAIVGTLLDPDYLTERNKGGAVVVLGLAVVVSIPPALAVLAYYRKKRRSDENPSG